MSNKAVIVGINKYHNPKNNLRGCINDANNMKSVLIDFFNFKESDIELLTDSSATKENIINNLSSMVDNAKEGDNLVFFFSGHGSQIRDINNDERKNRKDELICPYDMDWVDKYILDDELKEIFSRLPNGVHLEVFLDSCHSGTMTDLKSSNIGTSKFIYPPLYILKGDIPKLKLNGFDKIITNLLQTLFAACTSNQYAIEDLINGSYNGAFTYYLCNILRTYKGDINRLKLRNKTLISLRKNKYKQHPKLECNSKIKKYNLFKNQ